MSYKPAEVHYPAQMLVDGGPPFEVRCPEVPRHVVDDEPIKLSCQLRDNAEIRFYIHAMGRVLAESDDRDDILNYFKKYMDGVRCWAAELGS